ncbi:MAG TPA: DUF3822 family protein [Lunatimonas sp.]|nr:DUF3822 family protein [Lunatimonas sp.]
MSKEGKYLLSKFDSDRLDIEEISNLSLFLYSRLLSVLAKNPIGEVIGVHVYSYSKVNELIEIIETDNFIQSSNTFGKLYVHNDAFCLVPNHLFDPSHKEQYLNFTTEVDPDQMEIFYENIPGSEIQAIGSLSLDILKKFEESLPDLEIIPGVVFPLSFLINPDTVFEDQEIFVFPIPDHIYIAAFSLGTLVFFNSFKVGTENDLIKYTLTVTQQLGFDQESTKVSIMGDLSHVQSSEGVLSPYFTTVTTEMPPEKITYSPDHALGDFKKTMLLEAYWTI